MDPIAEFRALFAQAQAVDRLRLPDPTAMSLATVSPDGAPSNRIVLLKHVDERGFVFYTNLDSRKGRELTATPRAALCFYWPALDTQIRVEGTVEAVSDAEADAYFASRARESQIGAWASQQSETLASMDELRERVAAVEARFADQAVPRPPHWSGRRVKPASIEFWHAGEFRLHERRRYERDGNSWTMRRLFP
ncbi:MAG TPA: pyridoxamine 5'-phosphate oxidase [Gemmatimonadaceae bacterium]|nr:pyridoxamine 5'-phosphate oxidase [Gemmatimonadaceae bacterium]